GKAQIEYGLMTDADGRPVSVEVFAGNTADPTAFISAAAAVRERFGLTDVVMVGDRGMITTARIAALREVGGLGWVTSLRAPAIAALAADGGPLQLSLFDEDNLAELTHPEYPGERLVACRNPALAAERARKRTELLGATEALLAPIAASVEAGRLAGAAKIGLRVGRALNRYKMAKHFDLDIADDAFTYTRKAEAIAAEAALDGIYVIRTSVPAAHLDAPAAVTAYKNLSRLERDFRSLKSEDLDLRPIHHYLTDRVHAHVLICMLASYLIWHLRRDLAELTYTDQQPPTRDNPVASATRSEAAQRKLGHHLDPHGQPLHSFRGLLDHMATRTRNTITLGQATFEKITLPTPTQQRAFQLIGAAIPLT
ncbi:MAG: IS1634 family transposase, partial [Acidimicrobiales bacterium]